MIIVKLENRMAGRTRHLKIIDNNSVKKEDIYKVLLNYLIFGHNISIDMRNASIGEFIKWDKAIKEARTDAEIYIKNKFLEEADRKMELAKKKEIEAKQLRCIAKKLQEREIDLEDRIGVYKESPLLIIEDVALFITETL